MTTDWHRYQRTLPWYNRTRLGIWVRMGPTLLAEFVLLWVGLVGLACLVMFAGVIYTCWWAERWDTFERFEQWKEKELGRAE